MKRVTYALAAIVLMLCACEDPDGQDYPLCNDVDAACATLCHLVDICPNSTDAWMAEDWESWRPEDCLNICHTELGYTGHGSFTASWMKTCADQLSCAMFDGSYGCMEEWYASMTLACDGKDYMLVTIDGCTDRIDCVEFCQKEKHMGTAGCGAKSEEVPAVCICTDHPENY